MFEAYVEWPKQATYGIRLAERVDVPPGDYKRIVICGMGGSGIVGDIIACLAEGKLSVPVLTVKDLRLPLYADDSSLVFVISYSGNTLETLQCYSEAVRRGCRVVSLSSGGRLEERAVRDGVPHIKVPGGIPPRAALPLMLYPVVTVLSKLGYQVASDEEVRESVDVMLSPPSELVRAVAEALVGKFVTVVAPSPLAPLAIRWKNEINENAKQPAKVEVIPEWGHNDIVGWERPPAAEYAYLILELGEEPYEALTRFAFEYYSKLSENVCAHSPPGKSLLAKLIAGCQIAGMATVKMAEARSVDPEQTPSITMYKRVLESAARG